MANLLKNNSTPLKSREKNSNLIKGSVYSAKIKLSQVYSPEIVLKTTDLANGYHIFTELVKK